MMAIQPSPKPEGLVPLPTIVCPSGVMPIAAAFQLFDGSQVVTTGALRGVGEACTRYDDARVGQIKALRCHINPDGLSFETELAVSTRYYGGK